MQKLQNADWDEDPSALHARPVFCFTFLYMWQCKCYETIFLQCKNCSEELYDRYLSPLGLGHDYFK